MPARSFDAASHFVQSPVKTYGTLEQQTVDKNGGIFLAGPGVEGSDHGNWGQRLACKAGEFYD